MFGTLPPGVLEFCSYCSNTMSKEKTSFEVKEFDASISPLCWLFFCPFTCAALPYKTTLLLDEEEVTKIDVLCGKTESKRPYGELGSVDRGNFFCCVAVSSGFGEISPGCGCDKEAVNEIVNELKARQRGRGDTAQIQRTEQINERLIDMDSKLNLIMQHLNIPQPMEMTDRT